MNILFLRGFNNYFNRIVKKLETLEEYRTNAHSYIDLTNVNYNPLDGVATELIVGNENQIEKGKPLDWDNVGSPDYCIFYDINNNIVSKWFVLESERTRLGQYRIALKRDVVVEHYKEIMEAPCFVEKGIISSENNPLLFNSENMTYNQIKKNEYFLKDNTDCAWIVGYVSKNAPANDKTIKVKVELDGTPSTGYLDIEELPFTFETGKLETRVINIDGATFSTTINTAFVSTSPRSHSLKYDQFYGRYIYNGNNLIKVSSDIHTYGEIPDINNPDYPNYWARLRAIGYSSSGYKTTVFTDFAKYTAGTYPEKLTYFVNKLLSTYTFNAFNVSGVVPDKISLSYKCRSAFDKLKSEFIKGACKENNTVDNLYSYNGRVVKLNNKYYKIVIELTEKGANLFYPNNVTGTWSTISNSKIKYTNSVDLDFDYLSATISVINEFPTFPSYISVGNEYGCWVKPSFAGNPNIDAYDPETAKPGIGLVTMLGDIYSVKLESVDTFDAQITMKSFSSRGETHDAPFDIFAIPYGNFIFKYGGRYWNADKRVSLNISRAIATELGDNACLDLQILPYCPSEIIREGCIFEHINDEYKFKKTYNFDNKNLESDRYDFVTSTDEDKQPYSFLIWCSSSKGSFDIELEHAIKPERYGNSLSLDYKLANETEIYRIASPNFNGMFEFSAAKNKGVDYFNVDYTYKPYMPYIHINPIFKGLYGNNWRDTRGLICGGDFSLSSASSAWQNYQNNNKNYQSIFDRQIQNMDTNNSIGMEKAKFNAVAGTLVGGLSGAVGGLAASKRKYCSRYCRRCNRRSSLSNRWSNGCILA